jgi:hypothetical protein
MILTLLLGLLLFLCFLASLRLLFFALIFIYGKLKSFLGVMIEGSDYYWKWKFLRKHSSGKVNYKGLDIYEPNRGWTLAPNLKNKLHYGSYINSNIKGIRGEKNNFPKSKILFFGDSFCFGEGVEDNQTIPAYFEEENKGISSVNLGVHGYGIDQQYMYMKNTISYYKPKLTCFIIADNDFRRNFMDFRDSAKPKFELKDNNLIVQNIPVITPENFIKEKKFSPMRLPFELFKHFLIYYGIIGKRKRKKICGMLLDKIKKTAEENNSDLIFVYITDARRGLWYRLSYVNRFFINAFKKKKIKCLYVEKIVGKKRLKDMFDSLSGHFTSEANKFVAQQLSKIVNEQGILNE